MRLTQNHLELLRFLAINNGWYEFVEGGEYITGGIGYFNFVKFEVSDVALYIKVNYKSYNGPVNSQEQYLISDIRNNWEDIRKFLAEHTSQKAVTADMSVSPGDLEGRKILGFKHTGASVEMFLDNKTVVKMNSEELAMRGDTEIDIVLNKLEPEAEETDIAKML